MNKKRKVLTGILASGVIGGAVVLTAVAQACGTVENGNGFTDPIFYVKNIPQYWNDSEANRSVDDSLENIRRRQFATLFSLLQGLSSDVERTTDSESSRFDASSSTLINSIGINDSNARINVSGRDGQNSLSLLNDINRINNLIGVFPNYATLESNPDEDISLETRDFDATNPNDNFSVSFDDSVVIDNNERLLNLQNNIARFIESFSVLLGLSYLQYNLRNNASGWTSLLTLAGGGSGNDNTDRLLANLARTIDIISGGGQFDPSFNRSSLLNLTSYNAVRDGDATSDLMGGIRLSMVSTFRENAAQGGLDSNIDPIFDDGIEYLDLPQIIYLYNNFLLNDLRDETLLRISAVVDGDASNGSAITINVTNFQDENDPILIMQMKGSVSNQPAAADVNLNTAGEAMLLNSITLFSGNDSTGSLTFRGETSGRDTTN